MLLPIMLRYPVGNQETAALAPGSTVGNNNLKWEKTVSTNIGLDLGLWGNRVNLTLDWYNKSDDLLMSGYPYINLLYAPISEYRFYP